MSKYVVGCNDSNFYFCLANGHGEREICYFFGVFTTITNANIKINKGSKKQP